MDVWMILHVSPPGVQHTEKAGQIAPDVFFVGAKKFHGLRRGLEHGGIAHALMTADKKPELFGNREGYHEMVPGKLPIKLPFQPYPGFMALA